VARGRRAQGRHPAAVGVTDPLFHVKRSMHPVEVGEAALALAADGMTEQARALLAPVLRNLPARLCARCSAIAAMPDEELGSMEDRLARRHAAADPDAHARELVTLVLPDARPVPPTFTGAELEAAVIAAVEAHAGRNGNGA
jgi:hypothetical protein